VFSFLVTSQVGAWDSREYSFHRERFCEYTNDDIKARYRALDEPAIAELLRMPCLFAYEGNTHDMRVGYMRRISNRGTSIYFEFDFDRTIPPIPFAQFESLKLALDVKDRFELSRTHWAIKDENLLAVLQRKHLTPRSHRVRMLSIELTDIRCFKHALLNFGDSKPWTVVLVQPHRRSDRFTPRP